MEIRKICLFIFSLLLLLLLTGCQKSNEELKNEKVLSEVRYIENQSITIFCKYLSNEYINDDLTINWDLVNEEFISLKNSSNVILIDFASLNLKSKDIVELENIFLNMEEFEKKKDEKNFFKSICDCYSFVSNNILNNISNNEMLKLEKKVKSDLMYIGYYLSINDINEVNTMVDNYQNDYSNLIKNIDYIENNSYSVNKKFIQMQRIKTKINNGDIRGSKEDINQMLFES